MPFGCQIGRPSWVKRTTTNDGTGFGLKYPAGGSLDLPDKQMLVWIKDTNTFVLYVRVRATNGNDYSLDYMPTNGLPYSSTIYAIIPLGTQYRDGTWRYLERDLSADLQAVVQN
jgi:hypothetical protein